MFPGATFIQGATIILFAKFSRGHIYASTYVYSEL